MTAVLSLWPNKRPGRSHQRSRVRVAAEAIVLALLLILLAGLVELRRFSLPAPTGQFAVGTTTLQLTDASRHEEHSSEAAARRRVVVQLWYPTAAHGRTAPYQQWRETKLATLYAALLGTHSHVDVPVADGAFPVILYGPRWAGERTQNTALIEDLASHGYVVAAIDHPYNGSRVLLDGKVIRGDEALEGPKGEAASATERIAFWNQTLNAWAADERFVLEELARKNKDVNDRFHAHMLTEAVGALGHSFGGAAALRLLGLDLRVKAGVNMDGWTFGALADRTAQQQVMVIYEQESVDRRAQLLHASVPGSTQDELDRGDNAAVDASLDRFGGERLYIRGTQHLDFSDRPLLPPLRRNSFTGPIAPREIDNILRTAVRRFFDQSLKHQNAPDGLGMRRFSEVTEEPHLSSGR